MDDWTKKSLKAFGVGTLIAIPLSLLWAWLVTLPPWGDTATQTASFLGGMIIGSACVIWRINKI